MGYGNELKSMVSDLDIGKTIKEREKRTAIFLTVFFVGKSENSSEKNSDVTTCLYSICPGTSLG